MVPSVQFSSVQSLNRVWLFAAPWIAAPQASLSITNSRSSLRLMSIYVKKTWIPFRTVFCHHNQKAFHHVLSPYLVAGIINISRFRNQKLKISLTNTAVYWYWNRKVCSCYCLHIFVSSCIIDWFLFKEKTNSFFNNTEYFSHSLISLGGKVQNQLLKHCSWFFFFFFNWFSGLNLMSSLMCFPSWLSRCPSEQVFTWTVFVPGEGNMTTQIWSK